MAKKYYCLCGSNCKYETMNKEQILTAIANAVQSGTVGNVDGGFITTIKTINGVPLKFFVGTRADYNRLSEDDKNNTYAIITNEDTTAQFLEALEELEERVRSVEDSVIRNMNALVDGDVTVAYSVGAEFAQKDMQGNKFHEHYMTKSERATLLSNENIEQIIWKEQLVGDLPEGKTIFDVIGVTLDHMGAFCNSDVIGQATDKTSGNNCYKATYVTSIQVGVKRTETGFSDVILSMSKVYVTQKDKKIYIQIANRGSLTLLGTSGAGRGYAMFDEDGEKYGTGNSTVIVYFR